MLRKLVQIQARVPSATQNLLRGNGRSNIHIAGKILGHKEFSLYNHMHNGFRTFCSTADLSTKKCVPCNAKDLSPMTEDAAHVLMSQVDGWNLVTEDGMMKLHRSWKVKTFLKGLEFFKHVANVAEAEGHHPDLHLVGWNSVKIDIWTHAVGGLTENDFIIAAKINKLDVKQLLSKRVGSTCQRSV